MICPRNLPRIATDWRLTMRLPWGLSAQACPQHSRPLYMCAMRVMVQLGGGARAGARARGAAAPSGARCTSVRIAILHSHTLRPALGWTWRSSGCSQGEVLVCWNTAKGRLHQTTCVNTANAAEPEPEPEPRCAAACWRRRWRDARCLFTTVLLAVRLPRACARWLLPLEGEWMMKVDCGPPRAAAGGQGCGSSAVQPLSGGQSAHLERRRVVLVPYATRTRQRSRLFKGPCTVIAWWG